MQEPSRFRIYCKTWTASKDGNAPEQNEDACRIEIFHPPETPMRMLLALADGTTEAVYSSAWAKFLVERANCDWLRVSTEEFRDKIQKLRREFLPFEKDEQPPWYVRNKFLTQGSQATLLVACVSDNDDGSLDIQAISIGDGCLFHLRPSGQLSAFPIDKSSGFGCNPALVTTRPHHEVTPDRWHATVHPGDLLLLATDAVAHWILASLETDRGDHVLESLQALLETEVTCQRNAIRSEASSSEENPEAIPQGESLDWWHFMQKWWKRFYANGEAAQRPDCELAIDAVAYDSWLANSRHIDSAPRIRNDDSTLMLVSFLPHDGEQADASPTDARDQLACMRATRTLISLNRRCTESITESSLEDRATNSFVVHAAAPIAATVTNSSES